MFRTTIVKAVSPLASRRFISTTSALWAEGSTGSGSSRAGGVRSGDAFTKREQAQEEMYIKKEEREKLLALRQKLKAEREHIDQLDKDLEEMLRQREAEKQNK